MRLKLAGRERRKLVCSPIDEPLASNRVSDCLHAQFSWLKKRDRAKRRRAEKFFSYPLALL